MFSYKQTKGGWTNWSVFGNPVNIAAGDVLSTTLSTTKWVFNQFREAVATTATGDLSSKQHPSQQPEALSLEELEELEKKEETERLATLENKKREKARIKHELASLKLPPMAQLYSDFDEPEKSDLRCFHQIYTVTKEGKKYFYKQNAEDCPMSELEAYCRAAVDLIAHGHVPSSAIPVYNDQGKFIGLCSEAITEFHSIIKRPFTAVDFSVRVLDEKIMTLSMLKKLDRFARERRINLHQIVKSKALSEEDWTYLEETKDRVQKEKVKLTNALAKQHDWFNQPESATNDPQDIVDIIKRVAEDLIHFRNAQGFAITHTARLQIHDEDDLHRNNIGSGKMENGIIDICSIDFDMSKWGILYGHKKSGIIDNYTRDPSSSGLIFRVPTGRFVKTRNDISRLPNLQDNTAFYRPVAEIPTVPERVKNWINWGISLLGVDDFDITTYVSTNAYREEDKKAFAELTLNPIYIHYKFKTLLKYLLTDPTIYENLARLYVREDIKHEEKKIHDVLRESEIENINVITRELYSMGYELELAYTTEPKNHEMLPEKIYLYLDAYGVITLKATNSRGMVEIMPLSPQELGDHYESFKSALTNPEAATLTAYDFELLDRITAQRGYAQKNTMYEFKQFLRDYGNEVKEEILLEFKELNKVYGRDLFNLENVSKECAIFIRLADETCISSVAATAEIEEALKFNRIF